MPVDVEHRNAFFRSGFKSASLSPLASHSAILNNHFKFNDIHN